MKHVFYAFVFTLFVFNTWGQVSLDKCFIDAANDTIKTTEWCAVHRSRDFLLNFRITKKNSHCTLELKFHLGNYGLFSVSDTNLLWLKLLNGETIKLRSLSNTEAVKGGGSIGIPGITVPGVYVLYEVPDSIARILRSVYIDKMRIFTSKGYNDGVIGTFGGSKISRGFDLVYEKKNKIRKIAPSQTTTTKTKDKW